jgi:para-nitrobenzyl esterase
LQSLGAHHGAELAYVFQRPIQRDDPESARLSRMIGRYWINFAAAGNPNGAELSVWPSYRLDAEKWVDFAEQVSIVTGSRDKHLDLIDRILRSSASSTQ